MRQTAGQTSWLIEAYQGSDSRDEKATLSNFLDRQTDIVAYRSAVCNKKGSSRVHWILGRSHAKIQKIRNI